MYGTSSAEEGSERRISEADPRRRCLCGRADPSGPHLLWTCPQTADLRRHLGLRAPCNAAEERLMLPVAPPRHPMATISNAQLDDRLTQLLHTALTQPMPLVATDGAASAGLAAWAVAIERQGAIAGPIQGQDASRRNRKHCGISAWPFVGPPAKGTRRCLPTLHCRLRRCLTVKL